MTPRVMASASDLRPLGGLLALIWALAAPGAFAQKPEKKDAKTKEPAKAEAPAIDPDDGAVTAWIVKRVLPISGDPVDDAVVLVQGGKIKRFGPRQDVDIPSFAKRVRRPRAVVCPGFVHPASFAYTASRRRNFAGRSSSGNKSAADGIDPTGAAAEALARQGYTTLVVLPTGGGMPGQGALVRPVKRREGLVAVSEVVREENAVLAMGFEPGTSSKKFWNDNLKKARKYLTDLAAFEKAKASGKKTDAKPKADKKDSKKKADDGKKTESKKKPEDAKKADAKKPAKSKKPDKPKEPSKDKKLMPLVDVLEGRLPGILGMSKASSFLHFASCFELEEAFRPAVLFKPSGFRRVLDAWRVLDQLKALKLPVILPADLTVVPGTTIRRVAQRTLLDAGVPVALVPGDSVARRAGGLRFQLMELVRHGVSTAQALRAVTLTPAEILGIQGRCGSVDEGKDADLLVFSGDPLAPTSRLLEVVVAGETVYQAADLEKKR